MNGYPLHLNRTTRAIALVGLASLSACGGSSDTSAPVTVACADLASATGLAAAKLPLSDTTVTSAALVPAVPASGSAPAVPAHCDVKGSYGKHVGIDGQNYATKFRMRLPAAESWNGRFYMYGGGGTNGILSDVFAFFGNVLAQGYATIANDGGHDVATNSDAAAGGQQAFGRDPQARVDLGYNSIDMTARTGQALVKAVYGKSANKSYFAGCSNGGREGMMMTQRFPDYFDGVIANAPAFRVPYAGLSTAWAIQLAAEVVEPGYKSRNAVPDMKQAFTASDLGLVSQAILTACDALDGATDGMVQKFEQCTSALVHPQLDAITCSGAKTASCLTAAQVDAVKKMQAGPATALGQPLYASWPWDPGFWSPTSSSLPAWSFGTGGGTLGTTLVPGAMAMVFSTPPVVTPTTDFVRYMQYMDLEATALSYPLTTPTFTQSTDRLFIANDPDLSRFKAHGGKLMMLHGMGDGIFSINDTIRYFKAMDTAVGGRAAEFARLFPQAGMGHCGGGAATGQVDALGAMVRWVESGVPPDDMIGTAGADSGFPGRTRPICAYPKVPVYKGSGSLEDAANFSCQ